MTQQYSRFTVADNSGARVVSQITAIKGAKKDAATLGDTIVATVKRATPHATIQKKAVVKAVIVRATKPYRRPDGSVIRFDDNAVVIIGNDGKPVGTRVFGPIAREVRERGFREIISLAPEVV